LFPAVGAQLALPANALWTQLHSLSFGFSVWEVWGALANGGCLLLVPPSLSMSPQRFWPWLQEQGANVLSLTPSAFRVLTQQVDALPSPGALAPLQLLAFSGEPVEPVPLRRWFARTGAHGPQLVNMYALTETAGEVSLALIDAESADDPASIGKPLPDTDFLLLDAQGIPVADGEPGELFIGGPMVASGYFDATPEQAQRFVVDPLQSGQQRRYYRSGDLARRREDGSYAFVGRADRQLKIRGYRVEPASIEAALLALGGLRDALATAVSGPDGELQLAAFVIPEGEDIDPAWLQRQLAQSLPHYLVPERIVAMPQFPLTPNGKLDLAALQARPTGAAEPPGLVLGNDRDLLASIWAELLGRTTIADDDDFFDCGGYSLLALQLTLQVEKQLGVTITIRDLFEQPRFAGLLERIVALRQPVAATHPMADAVFAPARAEDEAPMRLAIAEARAAITRGQPPYAACVVKDGRVIACVHNAIWGKTDATAHAEIEAIREACRVLDSVDLAGCTVYSTCEPCSMCYSACVWAGVERIVYGVRMEDEERYGIARRTVPAAQMQALMGRPKALVHDFLREEMIEVFEQWVGLQSMLR
ncbi:MAG TPA: AMP-binding protein, partial [Arenimonas sp.]|nr:AMP-binding protein [Arenimonas sp.]